MKYSNLNPAVDALILQFDKWQSEVSKLREIILKAPLNEEIKWGTPCYTLAKCNVVLIHAFKEYCAILFFKGALIQDSHGVLIQQTANVQASRQLRFTSMEQISAQEKIILDYVHQAIQVEESGLKVTYKSVSEFPVCEEFQVKLNEHVHLKKAFEALTPGRQRAYLLHFAAAKQIKTREARIEKWIPQILVGKGLNDLN